MSLSLGSEAQKNFTLFKRATRFRGAPLQTNGCVLVRTDERDLNGLFKFIQSKFVSVCIINFFCLPRRLFVWCDAALVLENEIKSQSASLFLPTHTRRLCSNSSTILCKSSKEKKKVSPTCERADWRNFLWIISTHFYFCFNCMFHANFCFALCVYLQFRKRANVHRDWTLNELI
jgi:hypothetical protein